MNATQVWGFLTSAQHAEPSIVRTYAAATSRLQEGAWTPLPTASRWYHAWDPTLAGMRAWFDANLPAAAGMYTYYVIRPMGPGLQPGQHSVFVLLAYTAHNIEAVPGYADRQLTPFTTFVHRP